MSHCPMGLWNAMDNPIVPWDHGWDGQWDTHASVEGQVDIPWNVPLSHGTVGWDGQFTAFLDIYDKLPSEGSFYPAGTNS